jgi:hypothetical protein
VEEQKTLYINKAAEAATQSLGDEIMIALDQQPQSFGLKWEYDSKFEGEKRSLASY